MNKYYETLLQHSIRNENFVKSELAQLDMQALSWRESLKKWSVIEVLDHLNKVYTLYFPNFEKALNQAPPLSEGENIIQQRTLLARLSIYSQKPKGSKRRFKMKTFDFFQPANDPGKTSETIHSFLEKKNQFNELIKKADTKNLKNIKMPTALGDKMKFYVPECFEFILAHEDRHIVQIQEILKKAR